MSNITPPRVGFPFPSIALEAWKLEALTKSLIDAGVQYGLGKKAEPLSLQAGQFSLIDCSGFVRWAIFHGSGVVIPDGSVTMHEWFDAHGFKQTTNGAAGLNDGAVRIAFLSPDDTKEGIGHVMLVTGGKTCESHGHHGVDRRAWGSLPFMADCTVYVVNPRDDH